MVTFPAGPYVFFNTGIIEAIEREKNSEVVRERKPPDNAVAQTVTVTLALPLNLTLAT